MNLGYTLSGGAPVIKRYKLGATAIAGIPLLNTAAAGAGLANATTTGAANAVGVTVGGGTYSTTQGDVEGTAELIINPDVVYRIRMSDNAADGAALVITTNSVAETAGTVVTITTGEPAPNSPTMDEGTMVCIAGANVGQSRKVTSVAATTATATVPFLNDIASGDVFIIVPWTPVDVAGNNIQLSTTLLEADQTIAVGTGAEFRILDLEFDFGSQTTARQNSYIYATLDDHIFNALT